MDKHQAFQIANQILPDIKAYIRTKELDIKLKERLLVIRLWEEYVQIGSQAVLTCPPCLKHILEVLDSWYEREYPKYLKDINKQLIEKYKISPENIKVLEDHFKDLHEIDRLESIKLSIESSAVDEILKLYEKEVNKLITGDENKEASIEQIKDYIKLEEAKTAIPKNKGGRPYGSKTINKKKK